MKEDAKLTMDDVVVELLFMVRPEANPRLKLPDTLYSRQGGSHLTSTKMAFEQGMRAIEHRLAEEGYIERKDT